MAVVEMKKLNLIAMSYDKDEILDALQKTGAVEVKAHTDTEDTFVPAVCVDELTEELAFTETALELLSKGVYAYQSENNLKEKPEKDGFFVTYEDFLAAKNSREKVKGYVEKINALTAEKQSLKSSFAAVEKRIAEATPYASLVEPFTGFASTAKSQTRIGILPTAKVEEFKTALDEVSLAAAETLDEADGKTLLLVVWHKSVSAAMDSVLSAYSLTACPYEGDICGKEIYDAAVAEKAKIEAALKENGAATYALKEKINEIKLYIDHLTFAIEKEMSGEKLRATECTFFLEAFVPAGSEETVEKAIEEVSKATYVQFSDVGEEEDAPTLLKNNGLVSNFEGITNTFSTPNYREFDPNTVMSIFYALFMGFIVGDWGYGLLMIIVGGYLWWRDRKYPTGMSRLAAVFAFSGFFALFWGVLFNSFYGFAPLPFTVMPNPQEGRCTFIGIEVPSVLAFCLVLGVVHICVGYICKAYQFFRKGKVFDGICEGLSWAIFSLGVGLAIAGFTEGLFPWDLSVLAPAGGIIAGVALVFAVFTAGRHEKFVGKFIKGFGALYGIIGFASDIVSYARLYGLMLSGAVIAGIIANAMKTFLAMGNVFLIILGVVLLVVGNLFNLVIGLLGAYIHDSRLQYVEFYGRFYEGEGELFRPLGSTQKYVRLVREKM